MGSREARRRLLSEVFEICVTIREVMIARNELHSKALMISPPTNGQSHLGCEDPLMHHLIDLNHELAQAKREALQSGIGEDEIDRVIKFWKLK